VTIRYVTLMQSCDSCHIAIQTDIDI